MEATAQGTTRSVWSKRPTRLVRLTLPSHSVRVSHAYLPGAILGPLTACLSRSFDHCTETSLRLWACHIIPSFFVRYGHSLNPFISLICFASSLCPLNMLRFPLAYLDVYIEGFVSSFG